jgi:four helix bundle protein
LSEGLPSDSAVMRKKFFASAAGSCAEVAAALDLAAALGAAPTALANDIVALAFRLKRMLRGLK